MGEGAVDRRELADKIRNDHLHGHGKRRAARIAFVAVFAVACVGALAWFQLRSGGDAEAPEHANSEYGFVLTPELAGGDAPEDDPVDVDLYEDFLCSSCKIFQEQSGDFLAEQVADGVITLTYHPIAFLNSASTDDYARRAANAAACVADQAGVAAYASMHDLLLKHQPEQGGEGLSNVRLIELAKKAGADDIDGCVEDMTFEPWGEEALDAAAAADVSSTPTVRVEGATVVRSTDGEESMPGPDELEFAIEAAR
ncbi:DsbA family protein [Leucobacter sp. GX24907]